MHMTKENESKKTDGFSIVEMLIAVAIGLIVLAGLVVVFVSQKKAYDVQAQVAEMHQGARATLDMISQDIAGAGYNPTKITSFVGIPLAQAHKVKLRADLNGNGNTNDPFEEVTYEFSNSDKKIYRTTHTGSPVAFAENVAALNFQYFDADGNAPANTDEIRKIRIELTTRTSRPDTSFAANDGYRTRTLSSEVIPRNMVETIVAFLNTGTGATTTIIGETSTTTGDTGDTGDTDTTATTTTTLPPEQVFNTPTITISTNNQEATICAEVIAPSEYPIDVIQLYYMINNSQNWITMDAEYIGTGENYCFTVTGLQNKDIVTFVVQALIIDEVTNAYVVVGRSSTGYTEFKVQ